MTTVEQQAGSAIRLFHTELRAAFRPLR